MLAIVLNVYRCSCGTESATILDGQRFVNFDQSITPSMHCVETQTDMHPIPYHKDVNYVWNKWDLRRKAIKMADIQNYRTHSAQTTMTYHRHAHGTQTYGITDGWNQTDCEVKTQTDCVYK